ncbi:Uncharacterised protein [BD1-7 clade bacterium]|uniref:Uncharacterized protein n=1 Tax=BD1-7 clade bacterium TaxID=2029982 RepID=A0A5S9NS24_9GAMM|nr:Uncharacterised protein [BD1-7 clade bacterium]CAA0093388.1 Uncharacterised protein [BD1-7 clade bacterium]
MRTPKYHRPRLHQARRSVADIRQHYDIGSQVVILITSIFTIALFTADFTHDLLLEAAVFLVSVKLILMALHTQCYQPQATKPP